MEKSCENSVPNTNQPREEFLQAAQCLAAVSPQRAEEVLSNFQGRAVKCNEISPLVRDAVIPWSPNNSFCYKEDSFPEA